MQAVIENIKKKVAIIATEACGYSPMTMVISVSEINNILDEVQNEDGCMIGDKITQPCEHCENHDVCKLEKKDKCSSCGFVYPTKEREKTEAYKFGYNKAIDDFVEHITLPITTEEQISEIVEQLEMEN